MQAERKRLLHAFFLALVIAGCGLLAGMAITAAVILMEWAWSPVGVLLLLAGGYTTAAGAMGWLLAKHLRLWQSFAASLDQLHKDHVCFEELLA